MRYSQLAAAIAALHADAYSIGAPRAAAGPRVLMAERSTCETGTSFLPAEAVERAKAGNPIEKAKLAKDGTTAFTDIYDFAAKIREGSLNWEDIEKTDMDTRLKWVGLLHRGKKTPGRFMMRLRTPNGIVTSELMRFYADSVEPYGPELGVVDITTRQNIQLRGIPVEDADKVIDGLHARNQTSFQSALDNVRNLVGSPLAGIDALEMVDTRAYCDALSDLISLNPATGERGNPQWGNLPRKFNICVSGGRDDFAHTHINDIGFQPCPHAETGEMGFNVVFGGYMSIKRVAESVGLDMWIPATVAGSVDLSAAVLRIFRDEGARGDRQKARLMWLIESYGVEAFRTRLVEEMGDAVRTDVAQPPPTTPYERREMLGVHAQAQPGLWRVGVHVPVGRLSASECRLIAELADKYSAGEVRLTVEQNVLLPNVADADLAALLKEPALTGGRLSVEPGHVIGHTVSCTGSQFCGLALVETKASADRIAHKLDELVSLPRPLRIHWTGCPNSCGQVQAADIGIMGAPAKKLDPESGKNKAVPGCNLFVGGKIGEEGHLALTPLKKGIPLNDDDLLPELVDIAVEHFGATKKVEAKAEATGPLAGLKKLFGK
jgi:ferredoxin-nitrite reductase